MLGHQREKPLRPGLAPEKARTMSRETYKWTKASAGDLLLSRSTYGETGVHVTKSVDEWAERSHANTSSFERIMRKHDRRSGARHEEDLRGPPGAEFYTSHDPPGAPDTIIVNTEFDRRGRALSWAAFASEF